MSATVWFIQACERFVEFSDFIYGHIKKIQNPVGTLRRAHFFEFTDFIYGHILKRIQNTDSWL